MTARANSKQSPATLYQALRNYSLARRSASDVGEVIAGRCFEAGEALNGEVQLTRRCHPLSLSSVQVRIGTGLKIVR